MPEVLTLHHTVPLEINAIVKWVATSKDGFFDKTPFLCQRMLATLWYGYLWIILSSLKRVYQKIVFRYKQKNAFISCQGPLPRTFSDMWQVGYFVVNDLLYRYRYSPRHFWSSFLYFGVVRELHRVILLLRMYRQSVGLFLLSDTATWRYVVEERMLFFFFLVNNPICVWLIDWTFINLGIFYQVK